MFVTFLQMGLANGVQPLLGYYYGAGNRERFAGIESFTKKCCIITGILTTIVFYAGRDPVIRLFIDDPAVIKYGVSMLTAYLLSGPVIGILFVNMNSIQSTGNAMPATVLSVLRQGLLLIPLLYLLNRIFGLDGVIYGQALTDYIAVALWRQRKQKLWQSV